MRLSFGFTPCPNDAFAFHALVHGLVPAPFEVEPVLLDVHDVHVLGEVGEVDRALSVAAHEVQALAGVRTRASLLVALVLGVELDEPLVGDHGALAGEDVVVALEGDAEHLLVLQTPAFLGLRVVVREK